MRAAVSKVRAWSGAGAFLALLAVVLLAPSPSRADCSHPADRPAVADDPSRLSFDWTSGDPASDPAPMPPPKPCSGPRCSGQSAPPLASPPTVPPRLKLWALTVEPVPAPSPDPAGPWPEEAPSRPIRIAPSIFHPPQLPL